MPWPRLRTTTPSATSSFNARIAVVVDTPKRSTISRWVMNGSSRENSPRAIDSSSSCLTHANNATPAGGGGIGGADSV